MESVFVSAKDILHCIRIYKTIHFFLTFLEFQPYFYLPEASYKNSYGVFACQRSINEFQKAFFYKTRSSGILFFPFLTSLIQWFSSRYYLYGHESYAYSWYVQCRRIRFQKLKQADPLPAPANERNLNPMKKVDFLNSCCLKIWPSARNR